MRTTRELSPEQIFWPLIKPVAGIERDESVQIDIENDHPDFSELLRREMERADSH